jgi:hypothetical protein
MVFWEANGYFYMKKKFVPAFWIEIMRILMAADFVLQIGWVQAFFL